MRLPVCIAALVAITTVAVFAACSDGAEEIRDSADETPVAEEPTPEAPEDTGETKVPLEHDGGTILVELALRPDQRSRGLSGRESMPEDEGMLFVFAMPTRPGFWMRGMLFPIDIVWIDAERRITQITADVPVQPGVADADLPRYAPDVEVSYVLELNAGTAARIGLEVGDQLRFEIPNGGSATTPAASN